MSTVKFDTWTDSAGTRTYAPCTAWVNFNGTGTVAIRDSLNVSSITDNGTGDYTVNFATAMANTSYAAQTSGTYITSGVLSAMVRTSAFVTPYSTTTLRMNTGYTYSASDMLEDTAVANVTIHGGI